MKTKELIDELERRIARRDEVSVESVSIKRRLDAQTVWMDAALARLRLLERAMAELSGLGRHTPCPQCNDGGSGTHNKYCEIGAILSTYAALEGGAA